jgi:hypothetical protein
MLDAAGYPCEPPLLVHPINASGAAETADASFVPPPRKQGTGTPPPPPPVVFRLRGVDDRLAAGGRTVVGRKLFAEQFAAFTCHAFDAMTPEAWNNVIVAGGAVLGSLLPLEEMWRRIAPSPLAADNRDFVRRFRPSDPLSLIEQSSLTPDKFLTEVRWPSADVDVFIYGLGAAAADSKLATLVLLVSKALKARGAGELAYVRTPNTVTIAAPKGERFRKVQIITRLYKTAAEVINTFDIDCCCSSYDGTDVMCTPRARAAINSKLNVVNLSLRGSAYENRLVKYAQRGFAIGVPGLDKSKINFENVRVRLERSSWGGWNDFSGDGFSWGKWEDSKCSLLRILLMEQIASTVGYFDEPFLGRLKKEPMPAIEEVKRFHFLSDDDYPVSYRKGPANYAASTKLVDLVGQAAKGALKTTWQEGSMPRIPISWDDWIAGAYIGDARGPKSHHFDEAKWKKEREDKAKAEADKKVAEEAEKEALRREARDAAEALRVMQERLTAAEKGKKK